MSKPCVVDASAGLRMVMDGERGPEYLRAIRAAALVLAPALFTIATANGLWRYARAGQLSKQQALIKLGEAKVLIDRFEDDERLATEALALSIDLAHPVYDLSYLVLARRHGAGLVTADRKLAELGTQLGLDVLH